jgi:glycosyl transferase family 2/glycosyl transferase family 7 (putative galactosyltransferase)
LARGEGPATFQQTDIPSGGAERPSERQPGGPGADDADIRHLARRTLEHDDLLHGSRRPRHGFSLMLAFLSWAFGSFGRGAEPPPLPLRALRRVSRTWLRRAVAAPQRSQPDDVTVVIGVRNRAEGRLVNALRSIQAQVLPAGTARALVVDYGSDPAQAAATEAICAGHGARYVRVESNGPWSRARCMNVGLRMADTKFLMTSDVDILLSPRYLADAVRLLGDAPLSIVCSRMLDLPEATAGEVASAAQRGELRLDEWRARATPRYEWLHPSVGVGYTRFYQMIRGYDEFYEVWGVEDDDLMKRLTSLGLARRALGTGSFYLHQWHPKMDGILEGRSAEPVLRNQAYYGRHHSIVRNGPAWGTAGVSAAPPPAEPRSQRRA